MFIVTVVFSRLFGKTAKFSEALDPIFNIYTMQVCDYLSKGGLENIYK
jgi:hypothetical protein